MDKLTAWLVTIIGVLLVLPLIGISYLDSTGVTLWVIALAVLVIGVKAIINK